MGFSKDILSLTAESLRFHSYLVVSTPMKYGSQIGPSPAVVQKNLKIKLAWNDCQDFLRE